MCEMLAMSAKLPTDISFSFTGFAMRGGETGPHRDGFGICFYEGKAVREFKDYLPSVDSPIADLVRGYPIKSTNVISHVRQANVGQISLENTHPFQRELCGRAWTFAHNGQLPPDSIPTPRYYTPIGQTDSEKIFCWLLGEMRGCCEPHERLMDHVALLEQHCNYLNSFGVTNILLCDGESLFAFCSTKLCWITRRAPFGKAHLKDADHTIDFSAVTTEEDVVTVIATQPLTDNEQWHSMKPAESRIFQLGESVHSSFGPEIIHPKQKDSVAT